MRYYYKDNWYTIKELSEISGLKCHTIRDRLRRKYSIEEAVKLTPTNESVKAFSDASYYGDWIGVSITYLHEIYWNWCVSNNHTPLQKQGFSRHLFAMYPNLKIVPTKRGNIYERIIRER